MLLGVYEKDATPWHSLELRGLRRDGSSSPKLDRSDTLERDFSAFHRSERGHSPHRQRSIHVTPDVIRWWTVRSANYWRVASCWLLQGGGVDCPVAVDCSTVNRN